MESFENIKQMLITLSNDKKSLKKYAQSNKSTAVDEQIKKLELENKAFEQDIRLRKLTLRLLFGFLALETLAIFLYTFMQAWQRTPFYLEEWSFRLLIVATISQITFMLRFAVQYLFPRK